MELSGRAWDCRVMHGIKWSCMGLQGRAWGRSVVCGLGFLPFSRNDQKLPTFSPLFVVMNKKGEKFLKPAVFHCFFLRYLLCLAFFREITPIISLKNCLTMKKGRKSGLILLNCKKREKERKWAFFTLTVKKRGKWALFTLTMKKGRKVGGFSRTKKKRGVEMQS